MWGDREEAAFVQLKAALASAPVLITPDNDKPYTLHTDASGYAVGATLSQMTERGLQPVAFMSKKVNAAQRNYPVHEWELLAVMEALKAWRCYLYGATTPIDILTDHHSLQWISTQPTCRHGRVAGSSSCRTTRSECATCQVSPTASRRAVETQRP